MEPTPQIKSFIINDCALLVSATGKKARMLQEFRTEIANVDVACIYHHFWGGLLQPRFEEREYNNDFAAWVRHGIHDAVLAERLSALNPVDFDDLEAIRAAIVELIDIRIDESEQLLWAHATQQFEFVRSQIVVFDTKRRLTNPRELISAVENLSISSVFYHFIDARRRTASGGDDFSEWLGGFSGKYDGLRQKLTAIDPFFVSLSELRLELAATFKQFFQLNLQ